MSTSRRIEIRNEIIRLIKQAGTAAGDNVLSNPSIVHKDLPVVAVYTRSEDMEKFSEAPRQWKRDLTVVIEIVARGPEEPVDADDEMEKVEDVIDGIAYQIEKVLALDDSLGQCVSDLFPVSTDFEYTSDGEMPIASCRLTYTARYHQFLPASSEEQAGISNWETANVTYRIGHDNSSPGATIGEAVIGEDVIGSSEFVEVEDTVELPQ